MVIWTLSMERFCWKNDTFVYGFSQLIDSFLSFFVTNELPLLASIVPAA